MARTGESEQQLDHALLALLAESPGPVGATTLVLDLGARFGLSQASIGRKLMELDARGLTRRAGNRGRVITADGQARLKELERHLTNRRHNSDLLVALNATDQEALLDVLVARRALEREIARLAAVNATPEEIEALRRSIAEQEECLASGRTPSKEDLEFHEILARASRNKVLLHALHLVRGESTYSSEVAFMRRWVGGQLVADHRLIVECVASRSPEAAEAAIVQHISKLIDDVRRYFAAQNKQQDD